MPGLIGIISRESPESCKSRLRYMLCSMGHESFYNSGTYSIEDMGVYLGWTCHKGASNDCLPILNEEGDASLFLAGEVFPDSGLISDLKSRGHKIPSPGLSYLIHMYEEQGGSFFSELNGWFAGVLVDQRQGSCFVFNDRYGMKRLFIHEGKEELFFASEAKALLKVLPETRNFDPIGLAEFLTCGCTLGSLSLYKGIRVLPAASLWTIVKGAVARKSVYFDRIEWECQERLDASRFAHSVIETFPAVVRRYAEAQLPLGISLTGGFDSRMLMACLAMSPEELPCYTFGSMHRDTFDVSIARQVAKKCGQNHTVLVLGQDFLQDFPHYMEEAVYRSDGYLGLSGAAELYVNSLARDIAPIRLTGNYGSELLRGARAFKSIMPKAGFITPDLNSYLRKAQQTFEEFDKIDPISFALFQQAPYQGYGRLAIEESQVIMRTPFMDNDLVKLIYQRPAQYAAGTELSFCIIERYRPDLIGIPTDRGDLGRGSPLAKMIRSAYYKALFKGEYWASHGMPQWVAALTGHVPWLFPVNSLLGRHKFQHYRLWLRSELSEYVRDVLLSNVRLSYYLDRRHIEEMINSHLKGQRNFVDEIDMALTIVLSERIFLSQGPLAHWGHRQ